MCLSGTENSIYFTFLKFAQFYDIQEVGVMRGLIEKDLRLTIHRKQTVLVFVIVALFLAISGSGTFAVTYFTMLAGIVATGTLSYDEFDNGLEFLMTLPVDRKTYIREKYIFSLAASTIAWCISNAFYFGCEMVKGSMADAISQFPILLIVLPGMAVFATIIIPLQLKFGTEKGRIFLFVLFGCLAVGIVTVKNFLFPSAEDAYAFIGRLQGLSMGTVIFAIFIICALVGMISYLCSVKIMQNKQL